MRVTADDTLMIRPPSRTGQGSLRDEERCSHVDGVALVERGLGDLFERGEVEDARVADEDVQRLAVQIVVESFEEGVDVAVDAEASADQEPSGSRRLDRGQCVLGGPMVGPVVHGHQGTVGRESRCDGAADAP